MKNFLVTLLIALPVSALAANDHATALGANDVELPGSGKAPAFKSRIDDLRALKKEKKKQQGPTAGSGPTMMSGKGSSYNPYLIHGVNGIIYVGRFGKIIGGNGNKSKNKSKKKDRKLQTTIPPVQAPFGCTQYLDQGSTRFGRGPIYARNFFEPTGKFLADLGTNGNPQTIPFTDFFIEDSWRVATSDGATVTVRATTVSPVKEEEACNPCCGRRLETADQHTRRLCVRHLETADQHTRRLLPCCPGPAPGPCFARYLETAGDTDHHSRRLQNWSNSCPGNVVYQVSGVPTGVFPFFQTIAFPEREDEILVNCIEIAYEDGQRHNLYISRNFYQCPTSLLGK